VIELHLPASAWQGVDAGVEALVDGWRVQEGERVKAGQVLAGVVLVKVHLDVEAPVDGVVTQILVAKDATFKPGQALAHLLP
jgi:2-oxoglutarate dehydrogenase E2 component (dihydrolipoamide succinyltransferase)